MAFWRKISLSRAVSARVQIQRGVWKQGLKDKKEITKARLFWSWEFEDC